MRILIVEDDKKIAKLLKVGLESECFAVDVAEDGDRGVYLALTNDYDVILLDRLLPKMNGEEVCSEIRKKKTSPRIIIISAIGEADDKAGFLNMGADDYVSKPFSLTELIARIRAVMRRSRECVSEVFRLGDLEVDLRRRRVADGGNEVPLTKKEFMLLELLVMRIGEVVSRADIIEHVWDSEGDPFSNSIETHISNLRRKIRSCRGLIRTISGIGYRFDVIN